MDSADQRALAETYRDAGLQHITVAREVYDFEWYAPANYLAGLAVECVLRAYRTMIDPAFDARHDLGLLFRLARFGDVIPPQDIVRVSTALDVVVTLWSNDHRFLDESALRRRGTKRRRYRGIKGDFLKERVRQLVAASDIIVTTGAVRWKMCFKN